MWEVEERSAAGWRAGEAEHPVAGWWHNDALYAVHEDGLEWVRGMCGEIRGKYHDDEPDYVGGGEEAPGPGEEGGVGRCAGDEDGVVAAGGERGAVEPVIEPADGCDEARGKRAGRVGGQSGHRVRPCPLSSHIPCLVSMSLLRLLSAAQPAVPLQASAVRVLDSPPAFHASLLVRAPSRSPPPPLTPARTSSVAPNDASFSPRSTLARPSTSWSVFPLSSSRPLTRAS